MVYVYCKHPLEYMHRNFFCFCCHLDVFCDDRCGNQTGMCDKMSETGIDGTYLKSSLEKVSFKDESGKPFRFLPSGDAPPRYY